MACYFFDIQTGPEFVLDDEGVELPNHKAAEIEAMQTLIGLARDSIFGKNAPTWQSRFVLHASHCSAPHSSTGPGVSSIEAAPLLFRNSRVV
jgi:hypothetical protein